MKSDLIIIFAIYFSAQLFLSCLLLFIDVQAYLNLTGEFRGRDYRWEKTITIIFSMLQIILSIASLAGIAIRFRSSYDTCDWIHAGVMCSLQLGTGTSLARLLQVCQHPRLTVWLTYLVTLIAIPDNIPISFTEETRCISRPPVLAPLAIASLLCAAVSYWRLESHKSSGLQQSNKRILRLFTMLIITNASAAAIQLCWVILLAFAPLGEDSFRVQVLRWVLPICACTQVLCCLPVCFASTKSCFARLGASLRSRSNSMTTEDNVENGLMSLVTVQTSQSSGDGAE